MALLGEGLWHEGNPWQSVEETLQECPSEELLRYQIEGDGMFLRRASDFP